MQIISSPVDGYVGKLLINTQGSAINAGEALISIIPSDENLIIKANVLNKDIGFLELHQKVAIKIDTFNFQKYGKLDGELIHISNDSIKDEKLGEIYEIKVNPLQNSLLIDGQEKPIEPGMSVVAEIKVGKRRVIELFIYPIIRYLDEGSYSYEALLNHALKSSPNAKISRLNIDEAKAQYDLAKSNFYPTISLSANSEYSKRFDETYSPAYISDSSLAQSTSYQNSISLNLRYDIFKFRSDYYNAKSALTHINTTQFQNCEDEFKIALNLLELYYKALNLNYQIKSNEELKELYEILANYSNRLNNAGQMDNVDKTQYAIKLSQIKANLLSLKNQANLTLNQIYEISNLQISNLDSLIEFDTQNLNIILESINFKDTYIFKKLQSELEENILALKSLQRANFPTISLYAKYDLYGSDKDEYWQAHKNINRHGYRVGVSINYEIFDGGRKDSQIKRQEIINEKLKLQSQSEKLKFQKEKRDIMDFLAIKDNLQNSLKAINNQSKKIKNNISRLNKIGEKSKIELVNSLISTEQSKLELQEHILKSNFTLKKLSLIANQSKTCE